MAETIIMKGLLFNAKLIKSNKQKKNYKNTLTFLPLIILYINISFTNQSSVKPLIKRMEYEITGKFLFQEFGDQVKNRADFQGLKGFCQRHRWYKEKKEGIYIGDAYGKEEDLKKLKEWMPLMGSRNGKETFEKSKIQDLKEGEQVPRMFSFNNIITRKS